MLPEAEFAFLDEIFLGSTAILNTLLSVLNERVFRRGHTQVACPLRLCVGATNALPEEEALAAFADRFLVRAFVQPIPDPRLEELLEGGWSLGTRRPGAAAPSSGAALDVLITHVQGADPSPVRPAIAQAVRQLRAAGITLSDRRAVKAQRLVVAAAALAGREAPTAADLWPLVYAVPTEAGQQVARDQLRDLLASSESSALPAAAEEASQGRLARATRIAHAGLALLEARPAEAAGLDAWRLRLEGVAREIDAGFGSQALPGELGELRARLVTAIREPPAPSPAA
jgi:MoxR-like ATPase